MDFRSISFQFKRNQWSKICAHLLKGNETPITTFQTVNYNAKCKPIFPALYFDQLILQLMLYFCCRATCIYCCLVQQLSVWYV